MRLGLTSDAVRLMSHPVGGAASSARRTIPMGRVGLAAVFAAGPAFVGYVSAMVPVRNLAQAPVLTGGAIGRHWVIAVAGLAMVLALDAAVVAIGSRRNRVRGPRSIPAEEGTRGVPEPLRIQSIPTWALIPTALASATLVGGAAVLGLPLWQKTLWMLLPWVPLFVIEEVWKYRRYGFYAVFLGLAVLQVGHLGEHTVQVAQLMASDGDLTRSHGVFGQLDFETVHFAWDTAVWVGGGILVYRFWDNPWLWVSWLVASVHQVEHVYLFWLNQLHTDFWARGGIFGQGGLIGSPFPRPYLHLAYNFLVVIPMLVGLWVEAGRLRETDRGTSAI